MDLVDILKPLLFIAAMTALDVLHRFYYRPARRDRAGWKALAPGFAHYFSLAGSAAFALLMWWIYFFVGSARGDAEIQELVMLLLAAAMSLSAFYILWTSFLRRLAWRDRTLLVTRLGRERVYHFDDLADIEVIDWRNEVRLVFADGRKVMFSPDLYGADELFEFIGSLLPVHDPPMTPTA